MKKQVVQEHCIYLGDFRVSFEPSTISMGQENFKR